MVMLMVEVLFFGMICEATPANRKDRSGQGGRIIGKPPDLDVRRR